MADEELQTDSPTDLPNPNPRDDSEITMAQDTTQPQTPETPAAEQPVAGAERMIGAPPDNAQYANTPTYQPGSNVPTATGERVQPAAPPNEHPALQNASLLHRIGEVMAGGPQTTYKIGEDGKMVKTTKPLSTGQILMGILGSVLAGGAAGSQAKNPSQAFFGGAQASMQQKQQQEDQKKREASDEFRSNANAIQTNFQKYQNQMGAFTLGWDANAKIIGSEKEEADAARAELPNGDAVEYADTDMADMIRKNPHFMDGKMTYTISQKAAIDPVTGKTELDDKGLPVIHTRFLVVPKDAMVTVPKGLLKDNSGKPIDIPEGFKLKAVTIHSIRQEQNAKDNMKEAFAQLSGKPSDTTMPKGEGEAKETLKTITLKNKSFQDLVNKESKTAGVDPSLVAAVIKQESNEKPDAKSVKGAQGLMQLMPETAAALGVTDPNDPEQNIHGGVTKLAELLKKYDGNQELALAAYNAGEKAVADAGNKVPNFPETKKYVKSILDNVASTKRVDEQIGGNFIAPTDKEIEALPKEAKQAFGRLLQHGLKLDAFLDGKENVPSSIDHLVQSKQITTESASALKNLLHFKSDAGDFTGDAAIQEYKNLRNLREKTRETKTLGDIKTTEKLSFEEQKSEQHKRDLFNDNETIINAMGGGGLFDIKHISTMRSTDRQLLVAETARRYPNWNPEEVEKKVDLFGSASGASRNTVGSFSNSVMVANTSLGHIAGAIDAIHQLQTKYPDIFTNTNMANKSRAWFSKQLGTEPLWTRYNVALDTGVTDWQNLLNNQHALTDVVRKKTDSYIDSATPLNNSVNGLQEMAHTAAVRIKPLNEQWKQTMGKDFPNLIEPDTINAIKKINNPEVTRILGDLQSGGTLSGSSDGAGRGGKLVNELLGKTQGQTEQEVWINGKMAGYSRDGGKTYSRKVTIAPPVQQVEPSVAP